MSVKGLGVMTGKLEYFIKNAGDNLSKNFVGYFPLVIKTGSIHDISNIIRSKGEDYPFMIANTDAEDEPGTQWWSFLDIEEKDSIFLLNSFGTLGLLSFTVENDELKFNKVIKSMKNIFLNGNKTSMLKWIFQRNKYLKITQKELNQFQDTAFSSSDFLTNLRNPRILRTMLMFTRRMTLYKA